jgi:hypothetical protein
LHSFDVQVALSNKAVAIAIRIVAVIGGSLRLICSRAGILANSATFHLSPTMERRSAVGRSDAQFRQLHASKL